MRSLFSQKKIHPILFGLPRFATMFFYTSLVILSLPLIVLDKVGENSKGLHLGLITGGAALLSIGILYIFGIYRDRKSRTYQGVRYPLYGLSLSLPALVLISLSRYYAVLVIAFFILIISRALCEASHLSILTDLPNLKNRETYTAGIAFWHFLGSGLGAFSFGFLPKLNELFGLRLSSGLGANAILIVLISIFGFHIIFFQAGKNQHLLSEKKEQTIRFKIPSSLKYLIFARFFLLSGVLIISTFLIFVVRDYMGAVDVEKTTSLLYSGSILGAIISAIPAGKVVKRKGEILVLYFSGILLAFVTAVFFLFGPILPEINIPCMILYGAGFAGIISSGLSLTVKLIPHPQMSGRIMAIITASTFLAQFFASISGALVLDPLNRLKNNLGYFVLLAIIEIYFILGGVFLYRIRSIISEQKRGKKFNKIERRLS